MSRAETLNIPTAFLDGWLSHQGGCTYDYNPYNERIQHASHILWTMGYTARNDAMEHGWSLELDDWYPPHYGSYFQQPRSKS